MNKATIHITGVIGEDVFLKDVIRQFKSFKNATEVEVHIDSPGGGVDEGVSIYNFLRNLGIPVTTKASKAYSIAASIFMAGDVRLLEEGSGRFMIHMPWGQVQGGADTFESAAKMLRQIEDELTRFYSKYTDIDEDSIRRLLANETFLSAQEAVDLQLATGTFTPMKAVAFYDNNEPKKEDSIMTKAEKLVQAFASFLKGEETAEQPEVTLVALVLQDANGEAVEFPELDENESPEAGAKIMKNGEPVDGEILMPDGSKVIAEAGVVKEIVPAPEEEPVAPEAPAEEAQAQETPEETVEPVAQEEEVDYQALLEQFEAKILEKVSAQYQEKEEKLNAEILALKKELGSEIDNDPAPAKIKNSQSGNYLTNALRNRRK